MKYTKEYLEDNKICIDLKGNTDDLKIIDTMYGVNHGYYHHSIPLDRIIEPFTCRHGGRKWFIENGYTIWTIEQLLEEINTEEWYY